MIFRNLRKAMARKMKPKSLDEYDADLTRNKMPSKYSVYRRGGTSQYIKDMLEAESQGKYKFDRRSVKST